MSASVFPSLPGRRPIVGSLLLLLLIGLCVLRSALGTQRDSFTVDEPWHIVAGTSYARSGDFHLNAEHPPLMKLWVGAAMPESFRLRAPTVLSEKSQERTWVEQTMFADNDSAMAQHRSRAAMWTFHALLLAILAGLLWRAFDWAWAAGTLAFLAIEPTVGAHLPVVMTDLPLALTLTIAVVAAGLLAAGWQWRWVLACGVAIGLALGAKHSALAGLAGVAVVLLIGAIAGWHRGRWREVLLRLAKLGLTGLVAIGVLWALYGFHFHAAIDGSDAFNRPIAGKIAELGSGSWADGIAFADRWHLLPRAYLWGLADTVRTGLDARGISLNLVWGTLYQGPLPWFGWPAILVSKLPIALLALTLLGIALLWRARLSAASRWTLWILLGTCAFHLATLIASGGAWGGVRHAMPLIVAAGVLGGGAFALGWRRRSPFVLAAAGTLLIAALAMTIREPRLWEYHNELVGGSDGAWRYFSNEGLDLGQRFGEIRAFHDRVIAPSGLPMYSDYWMGEEQIRAAKLNYHRRVESLDDTNVAGRYEGYFVYPMTDTLAWPSWDWDPKVVFKDLVPVARFGQVQIWKGVQLRPQTRASSLSEKVMDYIYKENGHDWALVARRLEEVVALMPQKIDSGVELGNAYLRLGDGAHAIEAYRRLLDQKKMPLDAKFRNLLEAQVARIAASADPSSLEPLRNPWLE
ncbi:MAG TPA: phospholipid carrier-dependent glycosyltransferase [Rhodanobacteraceae bacterium]|nr:phospholipid carrier-dependent glycosyltransferase [Rhodanobacteraceae bacterium]